MSLLDSVPSLKTLLEPTHSLRAHSLIEWENKVDPVLYELTKMEGVKRTKCILDGRKITFCGNSDRIYDWIKINGRKHNFSEPNLFLYAYCGVEDLALLRRVNEFPDETPEKEILGFWAGESEEAASILLLNFGSA